MTMVREREATIVALARKLRGVGSWAGATHMQKCLYFLQEGLGVDLGYRFVIHHYGPFSFEVDEDLAALWNRGFLRTRPGGGYGVHYEPGPEAPSVPIDREVEEALEQVASHYGKLPVHELEVLATTDFVARNSEGGDDQAIIEHVKAIKPHISPGAIEGALRSIRSGG